MSVFHVFLPRTVGILQHQSAERCLPLWCARTGFPQPEANARSSIVTDSDERHGQIVPAGVVTGPECCASM
eukprot:6469940-Amphidinium_carterae.1